MESLFGPGMRPKFLPVVQFSYDLTEFSSPPHPSGFFQELSQLKRCVARHDVRRFQLISCRILADHEKREEQKIAEMLRQDDEHYSRLQADSPQSGAPSRLRRLVGWARDARGEFSCYFQFLGAANHLNSARPSVQTAQGLPREPSKAAPACTHTARAHWDTFFRAEVC